MKNNKWIVPFVGTILLGLSSFVLISVVELKVHIGMLTEDILSIDKQIGRIYNFVDSVRSK